MFVKCLFLYCIFGSVRAQTYFLIYERIERNGCSSLTCSVFDQPLGGSQFQSILLTFEVCVCVLAFRKQVLDDDKRKLRLYQERYLTDGDLHSDGPGRERRFRWKNIGWFRAIEIFEWVGSRIL